MNIKLVLYSGENSVDHL